MSVDEFEVELIESLKDPSGLTDESFVGSKIVVVTTFVVVVVLVGGGTNSAVVG